MANQENPLDMFEKSAKEMSDEELFESITKIHWRIKEAIDEDDKSMAYFYLGAVSAVTYELQSRQQKQASEVGKDFYFWYDDEGTEGYNGYDDWHLVGIVKKSFFDTYGHLDDRHIMNDLPAEVQKELGGEAMESIFEVKAGSKQAVIEKLTSLGLEEKELF